MAPPVPQDKAAKIADLSQFREDHPKYAGLAFREAQRAIVRLLRHCNFCVSQIAMNKKEIDATRAGLPSPRDFSKYGMQAIHSGVAWVRCNTSVADGEPVCFDTSTGNSVTRAPVTNNSDDIESNPPGATTIRSQHSDCFYVVGYAVSNYETVGDHHEVAVQFVRHNPIMEYGRLVADIDGFSENSGVAEGPYQELDEGANWTVQPCRRTTFQLNHAPWAEMGLHGWRWVYSSTGDHVPLGGEAGDWFYIEGYLGAARVINPHPFGFHCRRFYVTQSGDDYIIDRPEDINNFPSCSITGSGFKVPESIGGGPGSGSTSYLTVFPVGTGGGGSGSIQNPLYTTTDGEPTLLTPMTTENNDGANGWCIGTLWVKDQGSATNEYLFSRSSGFSGEGYSGGAAMHPPGIYVHNTDFLGADGIVGGGGGGFTGRIDRSFFDALQAELVTISGAINSLNATIELIEAQIRAAWNPTFNPAPTSYTPTSLNPVSLAKVHVSGNGYYAIPFAVPINTGLGLAFLVSWPVIGIPASGEPSPVGVGWHWQLVARVSLNSM